MKPDKTPSRKTPAAKPKSKPASPASKKGLAAAKKESAVDITAATPAPKGLKIPPFLLEGDAPAATPPSGPGQRYALGPKAPGQPAGASSVPAELPEAYGTKKLLLAARDPRWLYAHWDLTTEQLRQSNALSRDGHLVLRVFKNSPSSPPAAEIHVHPESRNWFVPVDQAGTKYFAELGYFDKSGRWNSISTSSGTLTPPETLSDDTSVRFATIPVDVPFETLLDVVKAAVRQNVPLAEAILQLRAEGHKHLPAQHEIGSGRWTPAQEAALSKIVSMDAVRRVWIGSLEITELIRRQLLEEISSMSAAHFSLPTSPGGAVSSISSAYGGMERRKGFWFNVNAELIIYGATEPDAAVTIGGRKIKLRPDGTFSYRFILPDGKYDLPAVATSADGDDSRSAALKFSRRTDYRGEVGAHPQDPKLKTPRADNVA